MNNYKKITIKPGSSVEQAVNKLLEYKNSGKVVFAELNGKILYSDTVTMDNAYLEITGMTKAEFEKAKQAELEKIEHNEEDH